MLYIFHPKKFAAYLQNQGYEAFSLEGGFQSYKQQGLQVEKTLKEAETKVA